MDGATWMVARLTAARIGLDRALPATGTFASVAIAG
jgi:hypothetical protein